MFLKEKSDMTLDALLGRIEQADPEELNAILEALRRRYSQVAPRWEVAVITVPAIGIQGRKEQAEALLAFIRKHYLSEENGAV